MAGPFSKATTCISMNPNAGENTGMKMNKK